MDMAARRIGGSDAAVIMHGEHYAKNLHDLWLEKTGQREPEDLSWSLRVQVGVATEALNRAWYEHETGNPVCRDRCANLIHPKHEFMTANLDGRCEANGAEGVFEAKHIGAFNKADPVETYYPQLQHYLAVTDLLFCHLSWFRGTDQWEYREVTRDDEYIAKLIEREAAFWFCVESMTPPPGWEPVTAPQGPAERVVDMTGSNLWAASAADWLTNRGAAKAFDGAAKAIKELIEPDVARAHGHGIEVVRQKRGLTIRETV